MPCSLVGWQVPGDPTQPPLPLPTVNQELVRRVHGKDTLVVHSNMERDVGLLRLYPGIPAALVESPVHPLPSQRAPGYCGGSCALSSVLCGFSDGCRAGQGVWDVGVDILSGLGQIPGVRGCGWALGALRVRPSCRHRPLSGSGAHLELGLPFDLCLMEPF